MSSAKNEPLLYVVPELPDVHVNDKTALLYQLLGDLVVDF